MLLGRLALGLLAPAIAACGSSTSLPIDAHCNPLGVTACLAPWPSSAFEIADDSTVTGRRLAIPEDAIPRGVTDTPIDAARWNALDGFSASTPIVVAFPGAISSVGLPLPDNMDVSKAADSPTVILDMTTGERVAHHVVLEAPTAEAQALVLHPAARLAAGHRYAVAITSRVVAADGGELPLSPGFRALRDDRPTDHGLLEAMRPRFDDVLDALDEAGIAIDELVLAWDFTVASTRSVRTELAAARQRARTTLASHPSLFRVSRDRRDALGRHLTGTFDGPLFLSNGGEPRAGTRLVRDDAGLPAVQGLYRIPFTAIVPACRAPMPLVIWGHAAFGDHADVTTMRSLAAELCMVFAATDLRGLSRADLPAVQRVIEDLSRADELDTIVQGMIDHETLVVAMRSLLAAQLDRRLFYLGDSAALAALPGVQRAAIVEPRLDRALPLGPYDAIDAVLVQQLIEARWDRVLADRLDRPVLVLARGGEDASWLARSFGLPIVGPSPTTPWGVKTVSSARTSGLVLTTTPRPNVLRDFLRTGQITPATP